MSMKGERGGQVGVRYISDTGIPDSCPAEPALRDLYLWLFRREAASEGGEIC